MKITVTYNEDGNHEATAMSGEYVCTCLGLSDCGEASFTDNFDGGITIDDQEEMRDAAYRKVKQEWDYDGSNWSEPVDEPDDELVDDPDDDHQIAVVKTAFHGGGVRGYATSKESAEEWIRFLTSGSDCKCGCFGTCEAREVGTLPEAWEARDPRSIAK